MQTKNKTLRETLNRKKSPQNKKLIVLSKERTNQRVELKDNKLRIQKFIVSLIYTTRGLFPVHFDLFYNYSFLGKDYLVNQSD